MGAVRYPRLHISLPVRHGTDAATLEKSAGHLYGTSLPVGDESTHAVVAAHRGLADRLMFTNLGLAKKGDLFEIDVQGERLRYKVTDIRVNGPDDVKPLAVEKGRDLVTLYTCTPYGVNTQRLLVTGERTDAPSGGDPGPVERLPDWLVPLWGLCWGCWSAGPSEDRRDDREGTPKATPMQRTSSRGSSSTYWTK